MPVALLVHRPVELSANAVACAAPWNVATESHFVPRPKGLRGRLFFAVYRLHRSGYGYGLTHLWRQNHEWDTTRKFHHFCSPIGSE